MFSSLFSTGVPRSLPHKWGVSLICSPSFFPLLYLLNLLLTEGEKRPSEDMRGAKRRGLVFLPSVWFPVCRWEDVKTVAAAFTQCCSFLTPGNKLRCHIYISWLAQGVCVKLFFFWHFAAVSCRPPFPISTASCRLQLGGWKRAVEQPTHFVPHERDVNCYGSWLVSDSPG